MTAFAEVARTIAKGDPPEWLVLSLEHFSTGIGITYEKGERQGYLEETERLNTAIGTLLRLLPAFQRLPFGMRCGRRAGCSAKDQSQLHRPGA